MTLQLIPASLPAQPVSNGFTLAIIIMIFMALAILYSLTRIFLSLNDPPRQRALTGWRRYAMLVLFILGILVSLYLTYVETQSVQAVCGPVGDCNAVQSSRYAKLFGVLPIGLLGLGGYIAMLVTWWYSYQKQAKFASLAPLALFGMALFGVIFSLYLTYLEPFVIKAVCIWCLSSAVIITLILLNCLDDTILALSGEE
ncbi:MAG: vitamin K epoxide reductase family protein [Chloroflexota bacterium]